jgi:hypothetical protein
VSGERGTLAVTRFAQQSLLKAKSRDNDQDDLFQPRLVDIIDMKHELVRLEQRKPPAGAA